MFTVIFLGKQDSVNKNLSRKDQASTNERPFPNSPNNH